MDGKLNDLAPDRASLQAILRALMLERDEQSKRVNDLQVESLRQRQLAPVDSRALGRVLLQDVLEEISDSMRKSWEGLSRHSRTIHPSPRSSNRFAPDNTGLWIMQSIFRSAPWHEGLVTCDEN